MFVFIFYIIPFKFACIFIYKVTLPMPPLMWFGIHLSCFHIILFTINNHSFKCLNPYLMSISILNISLILVDSSFSLGILYSKVTLSLNLSIWLGLASHVFFPWTKLFLMIFINTLKLCTELQHHIDFCSWDIKFLFWWRHQNGAESGLLLNFSSQVKFVPSA